MKTEDLGGKAAYPVQIEMDHEEWALTLKALIQFRQRSVEQEETAKATDLIEYMSKAL